MSDTKFFTNEEGKTLLNRFRQVLNGADFFDILVGFFRASGFFKLYDKLQDVKKIRILVGINVNKPTYELIREGRLTLSGPDISERIGKRYIIDVEESDDKKEIEEGINKFIEFIKNEKLIIKAHPSHQLHAKVYIIRYGEDSPDFGRVITGSSNFSESGLVDNLEFNVELKDSPDVKFALEKFEELWKKAVDVSTAVAESIKKKTYLNDQITPYELYLKFLYEYFKERINLDLMDDIEVPEGYLNLEYQKDAVIYAKEILKKYNGVFLSDVVGLGKTYMAALLAKLLNGRTLVITPPILKTYWEDVFREFGVRGFLIESYGKLDQILENVNLDKYSNVFIDESHLFRNQITESFVKLHEICIGKKVVLVSATPINNSPQDIETQIYLFQPRFRSNLPGIKNLYKFFKNLDKRISTAKNKREYIRKAKENSKELRERILKYLMVRRTRTDIKRHYKQDLKKQGMSFPQVEPPNKVFYQFTDSINTVFDETIDVIKNLNYARYRPSKYLKKEEIKKSSQSVIVSEGNLTGFIKAILLKRLDSSFYAFRKTVERVIESHENFLKMIEKTKKVYISKKIDIFSLLDSINEENADEIIKRALEEKKNAELIKYDLSEFTDNFLSDLEEDIKTLKELKADWDNIDENEDPKLEELKIILNDHIKINERLEGKDKKVVIFTESKETADYLDEKLSEEFGEDTLLSISSESKESDMLKIRKNFDPLSVKREDNINILITTEVLSEGVNLHRSNIIINYDIPWNSTKILQRVGRVNRIGTKHSSIYIYNFFPTARTSEELTLETLAKAKMEAFQEAMGEDAQYLTEEENVNSHELFSKINSVKVIEEEGEESDDLKYLNEIRKIRDKEKELFEKIKKLPKKARTARAREKYSHSLLTFFRQGEIKRFFLSSKSVNHSEELDFIKAVKLLKAKKETPKFKISAEFYNLLVLNKRAYSESLEEDRAEYETTSFPSNSNEYKTLFFIKILLDETWITEYDKQYLNKLREAIYLGYLPKKKLKDLIKLSPKRIENDDDKKELYKTFNHNISVEYLYKLLNMIKDYESSKKEIILSEEFL